MISGVISSPGERTGIPGGYGVITSAQMRPALVFETHELGRRQERFARRHAHRWDLRQRVGAGLQTAFEHARRREDVDRPVLARQFAHAVHEPVGRLGRRPDRKQREAVEQVGQFALHVVAAAQDLFGLVTRIAEGFDRYRDLGRVEVEDARPAAQLLAETVDAGDRRSGGGATSFASSIVRESSARPLVAIWRRATFERRDQHEVGRGRKEQLDDRLQAVDRDARPC